MTSLVLEEAFPTWKMLDELVDSLLKPGAMDKNTIQTLANMVMSKEFSRTFIYTKEHGIDFQTYEDIVDKYRSFTTWLVGQFFYLLGCDDNEILVDAQLSILDQLSRTQVHIYADLAAEYCKASNVLCEFLKISTPMKIDVFYSKKNQDLAKKLSLNRATVEVKNKKMCLNLFKKLLKLIEFILVEGVNFYSLNSSTYVLMDNLLYVLSLGHFQCEIFQIFIKLLGLLYFNIENWNFQVTQRFSSFCSLFEQLVYDFYNNSNSGIINKDTFEVLLSRYLTECHKLSKDIGQNEKRISTFLVKHLLENNNQNHKPSHEIIALCIEQFNVNSMHSELVDLALNNLNFIIESNNSVTFNLLKPLIFNEISEHFNNNSQSSNINVLEHSATWKKFCTLLNALWDIECNFTKCIGQERIEFCNDFSTILLEIKIQFYSTFKAQQCNIYFFNGNSIVPNILSCMAKHYSSCHCLINPIIFLEILVKLVTLTECKNLDIIFHLISCKLWENASMLSDNYVGPVENRVKLKADLAVLYNCFANDKRLTTIEVLKAINQFFSNISSGFIKNINRTHVDQMETFYLKIVKNLKNCEDSDVLCQVIENIPDLLQIFSKKDEIIDGILLPLLPSKYSSVQRKIAKVIPAILCTSSNDFTKLVTAQSVKILCKRCDTSMEKNSNVKTVELVFLKNRVDLVLVSNTILKTIVHYIISQNEALKTHALNTIPYLAQHIVKFFSVDVTKIWIEAAGDNNEAIRRTLAGVIRSTVAAGLNNMTIHEITKKEVLDLIFSVLLRLTKKSLQYSDHSLQETLLDTLNEMGQIDDERVKLECLKIIIYFVMVPTSVHSFVAVSRGSKLSELDVSGQLSIYKHYTETICETIGHLCYCNQHIVNASLQESLVKVAVMLGFDGAKDFVNKEAKKLLPHLVAKIVKNPKVGKLISDMACLMDVDVSDLLVRNYGNIFLHLFLGNFDANDTKRCLTYLETTTKLSGPKLRKLNIRVILNELLMNFHEKRQQVLTTYQLLLSEDNATQASSIEDYIQPYFLPFLLYFDLELTSPYSKKEKIIPSLTDLLKFLGPNRIMPLRFKIIAMLQTGHFHNYPELTCTLWEGFVQSCDIDCLGPHLATIFIAMLPLIEKCPNHVNKIFRYLIVENERHLKDYITDLFFVNNTYLSPIISNVIKKYEKTIETLPLNGKITRFLKYLKHDTLEVRIQSLRQLKNCLESNREELDQMILGYNGIDDNIVELIDYLTMGCREKNQSLKLACGDVFGQLGAIEPSHLPRRCAPDNESFIFFISEDSFIESALNELIKEFQTDKNARNTDRVALAIQEILKTYEIAPDESSSRHFMWTKFSEAQREVMMPLLSSKYICVEKFLGYSCPVYGSSDGSTFQAWLYNWTSSIINTLVPEKRSLLQSCFPSMKLDNRVLMHFLPYILLHSLLEGVTDNEEKIFKEFEAILKSFNTRRTVTTAVIDNIPLPIPGLMPIAREISAEEEKQTKCTKVMFILLDFLDRWLREWQWCKGASASTDHNYQSIKRFLNRFCKMELAECNYKCGEYPRALLYLEGYITENPDQVSANLQFLGEIYAQLDEPDGVLSVEPLQEKEPSLEQKLLSLEVSGKLNDAAAIYEHMPRPLQLQHIQGLIQCYLDLDKVNTALYCAEGALEIQPEFGNKLLDMQAEALWRLGTYDDLRSLLNKADNIDNKGWGVQVGKSLLCIQKGERSEFKHVLESIKKQQVEAFGAASLEEGAYHHGYNYIIRLHCLTELEQLEKCLFELILKPNDHNYAESIVNKLLNEWQLRLKVVQGSVRVIEPLLCLRRVALRLARDIADKKAPQAVPYLEKILGETWLQSVNVARSAGIHQQAYTYVLDAEKFNPPMLFIEKAKLHWLREEHEQALITVKRGLNAYIPDGLSSQEAQQCLARLSLEQKKLCAEARLLIATYNNDICSVDVDTNLQQYKEAVECFKEWEKSLVALAQYQDRILQSYTDELKDVKANEFQLHIVHNFGRSLYYGTNYIYQSMPRLLSIWFDYGTRLATGSNSNSKEDRRIVLVKMTKIIDSFLGKLPAFVFLTSFSQIISRIAHPQKEVYMQLKSIIVHLMQHYPQQCLWMISSVIKSSYPIRAKRCAEILNDQGLKIAVIARLIRDFTSLTEKLIDLCNKEVPQDLNSITVSLLVRILPRLLSKDFSEIMMPTHKFRKLILPNPDFKNADHHNPFPNHYVHIAGIDENITILNSLQRPRKISFRGSDGKSYAFMLKPKDDLRKDFRLMEFNDIVNHLLLRDPEARQRRLNIRLYSVAPLNEECGLIEWVHDLVGLRPVLMNIYKQKGLGMKPREIKEICCTIRDPLNKKREIFKNVLLKRHPPVLGEWFRKTFPDAQTWLTARTAYIRTTSVISITGYILGLGDRHGENILLDSTSGDVVHVDFNCLFNKGETFEWPERVPFRLTQNMIAAMGPIGVEGVFRKSCEFTLRVLRSNTATLMSIVTPFVYDPLVSWPRNAPVATQNSEKVNEQALEHIKNIELRLQGKVKTRSRAMSQCLSIEGQIDYLINEAKSVDNLCQMYVGWGPYL
ncbi:hypothetical protein ABEB36_002432 [Hypothenemus hampei]|uniref:non-specific serine/threonine protein kinase n=1 Tax=Hypothenemus hampei TaxID=57062 RepID=A0ABD1F5R1_HYPHA